MAISKGFKEGTLSKLFSMNLGVVVCLIPYPCLLSDKNITQLKKSHTEMLIYNMVNMEGMGH